jgi:hypothetical protein
MRFALISKGSEGAATFNFGIPIIFCLRVFCVMPKHRLTEAADAVVVRLLCLLCWLAAGTRLGYLDVRRLVR